MVRISRRLVLGAVATLAATIGICAVASAQTTVADLSPEELAARLRRGLDDYSATPKADHSLKILFLGGTGFIGPHTVNYALARGHEVTLFNRDRMSKNEAIFPDVEAFVGDRDPNVGDGLTPIEEAIKSGRKWDVVVDTSGYVPRIVSASAELLKHAASQYIFISSISAYADAVPSNITEDAAVATMEDPTSEDVRAYYGALKALCEQAAEKSFPGKCTNIRPGLIVGPKDPTNRFAWWPVRIAKGGKVLAPPKNDPVQVIDARDLAEFIVTCAENKSAGIYNVVGPGSTMTVGEMLEACKSASGSDAEIVYADAVFLSDNSVEAWRELPVWTEPGSDFGGFGSVSNARAKKAGLKFRPIEVTCKDTLVWWNGLTDDSKAVMWDPEKSGHLAAEREAQLVAEWEATAPEVGKD